MEKFILFEVGGEPFGLAVAAMARIVNPGAIRPVPDMPAHITGVQFVRGEAVPLMDLRLRFSLPSLPIERGGRPRLLVVRLGRVRIGLVVDAVRGIEEFGPDEIRRPPAVIKGLKARYVSGLAERKGEAVIFLNLDALITAGERIELDRARRAALEAAK